MMPNPRPNQPYRLNRTASVPVQSVECIHRSALPLVRTDETGRECQCVAKWLYACDVHGKCRPAKDCSQCSDREE